MEGRKVYTRPIVEVCSFRSSDVFMLQASLQNEEGDFVGAKEQTYDLDDWPADPWEDHVWQEDGKVDVWEE